MVGSLCDAIHDILQCTMQSTVMPFRPFLFVWMYRFVVRRYMYYYLSTSHKYDTSLLKSCGDIVCLMPRARYEVQSSIYEFLKLLLSLSIYSVW